MIDNPAYKGLEEQYFQGEKIYNYGGFIPEILLQGTPPAPSPTPSITPSATLTPTPTITSTITPTPTYTPTNTPSPSATPPSLYDADYQAILDYATLQGYTLPSDGQKTLQNQLVVDLKTGGIWTDLDIFYVFATDGDKDFAKINWKNPNNYFITENGSMTFTTNVGYKPTTNVNTNYLSTGFNLATNSTAYTLNDAARFVYDYDGVDTIYEGNIVDGGNRFRGTNTGGARQEMRINGGNLPTPGLNTLGVGMKMIQRTSSTIENVYVLTPVANTYSVNSTSIVSQTLTFFRSGAVFGGGNISLYGAGASLTGMETDLFNACDTYMTSI